MFESDTYYMIHRATKTRIGLEFYRMCVRNEPFFNIMEGYLSIHHQEYRIKSQDLHHVNSFLKKNNFYIYSNKSKSIKRNRLLNIYLTKKIDT